MNHFLDDVLVGVLLFAALGYATYALGPKVFRARLLVTAARLLQSAPAFLGLRGVGSRVATGAARQATSACGGCESCGSAAPVAGPNASASAEEVRIPLATIRRRQ